MKISTTKAQELIREIKTKEDFEMNFQKVFFGGVKGKEPDTPLEEYFSDQLERWTKNGTVESPELFKLLIQYNSSYPADLIPSSTKLYRGALLPFAEADKIIRKGKLKPSNGNVVEIAGSYKPFNKMESWTTRENIAFSFATVGAARMSSSYLNKSTETLLKDFEKELSRDIKGRARDERDEIEFLDKNSEPNEFYEFSWALMQDSFIFETMKGRKRGVPFIYEIDNKKEDFVFNEELMNLYLNKHAGESFEQYESLRFDASKRNINAKIKIPSYVLEVYEGKDWY